MKDHNPQCQIYSYSICFSNISQHLRCPQNCGRGAIFLCQQWSERLQNKTKHEEVLAPPFLGDDTYWRRVLRNPFLVASAQHCTTLIRDMKNLNISILHPRFASLPTGPQTMRSTSMQEEHTDLMFFRDARSQKIMTFKHSQQDLSRSWSHGVVFASSSSSDLLNIRCLEGSQIVHRLWANMKPGKVWQGQLQESGWNSMTNLFSPAGYQDEAFEDCHHQGSFEGDFWASFCIHSLRLLFYIVLHKSSCILQAV